MSIGPPIPEIQHFQNLTLKIKGQGHGWGHSLKSQCGSNILSTHIPFVPCQSGIPFLGYDFLKIWPWKWKVKVMGEVTVQSHNVGLAYYRLTSLLFHVNRPSHSWDTAFSKFDLENQGSRSWMRSLPFLRYSIFKIWPWKSRVKVMDEVTVQSHNVGLASYRLTSLSLHVNRPSHSWDTAFSKFDLENQGSRSWGGHSSKSQCGPNILSTHIPFVPCQSALPFLRYSIFKIWPWKSRVKVKWPWCCTTRGLDNYIELRMIWVPQSLAQVLPDLTSFWPMGKPIWGKWANNYDSAQLQF